MNILEELVKLADELDKKGLTAEANMVDGFVKTAKKKKGLPPFLEPCPECGKAMKKGAKMCKKCSGK